MDNLSSQSVLSKEKLSQMGRGGVMRSFPGKKGKKNLSMILASFGAVLAGVLTGWVLTGASLGSTREEVQLPKEAQEKLPEGEEGIVVENGENIKEEEGTLVEGGIEGEGTHHLERPGGPSQNVYLTSTSLSLDGYVGKKVHVWGEVLSGIKAGYLMDVVKIKEL